MSTSGGFQQSISYWRVHMEENTQTTNQYNRPVNISVWYDYI